MSLILAKRRSTIVVMTDSEVYAGSSILGAMSGMRSMSGLALVSQTAHSGLLPLEENKLGFLRHPGAAQGSFLASLGEIVADKLPSAPARIEVGPLLGRALLGGFSGATYASSRKKSVYLGAFLGTVAAIGTTYAAYHLRRFLSQKAHIPDTLIALAEDAAVVACGSVIVEKLHDAKEAA